MSEGEGGNTSGILKDTTLGKWQKFCLAIILGTLVPLTTLVYNEYASSRELLLKKEEHKHSVELAKQKQQYEIQNSHLRLALGLEAGGTEKKRLAVLRFLSKYDDPALQGWAKDEVGIVQKDLDQLKTDADNAKAQEKRAEKERDDAKARARLLSIRLRSGERASKEDKERISKELEDLQSKVAVAEKEREEAARKAASLRERLNRAFSDPMVDPVDQERCERSVGFAKKRMSFEVPARVPTMFAALTWHVGSTICICEPESASGESCADGTVRAQSNLWPGPGFGSFGKFIVKP